MKNALVLLLLLLSSVCYSDDLRGNWKGKGYLANSDTIEIEFNVIIQKDSIIGVIIKEPTFFTLADSSFNGTDLHLLTSKLRLQNRNKALLERKAKGEQVTLCQEMKFDGQLTDNINQLVGELTYLGKVYRAALNRGDQPAYRPQTPKKPYPYYSEEVKFTNKHDSVILTGTLTLPSREGKFPAVILKGGSMPNNRNGEDAFHHQRFLVLADYLTRNGIAVLRYDDRSVDESKGDFWQSTPVDYANDLQAGYELLASRTNIKSDQIGIIGHSEGGMVAAMAASQSNDFSFIVMLASPGIPLRNVFDRQMESRYQNGDIAKDAYELNKKQTEKLYQLIDQQMEPNAIRAAMFNFNNTLISIETGINPRDKKNEIKKMATHLHGKIITSPHNLFNLAANPAEYISKLTCPVLSLNGNNDLQVNAKINQEAIKQALMQGGNKDFMIVELDGLNHYFQECKTGTIKESQTIDQTFSPKALEIITQWIEEHVEK